MKLDDILAAAKRVSPICGTDAMTMAAFIIDLLDPPVTSPLQDIDVAAWTRSMRREVASVRVFNHILTIDHTRRYIAAMLRAAEEADRG